MEALTLAEALGWVRDLGSIALLTMIVLGAIARQPWWIPGELHRRIMDDKESAFLRAIAEKDAQFTRVLEERDAFRDELFNTLRLASRAAQVADRATEVAFPQEVPTRETSTARMAQERETNRRLGRPPDRGG